MTVAGMLTKSGLTPIKDVFIKQNYMIEVLPKNILGAVEHAIFTECVFGSKCTGTVFRYCEFRNCRGMEYIGERLVSCEKS